MRSFHYVIRRYSAGLPCRWTVRLSCSSGSGPSLLIPGESRLPVLLSVPLLLNAVTFQQPVRSLSSPVRAGVVAVAPLMPGIFQQPVRLLFAFFHAGSACCCLSGYCCVLSMPGIVWLPACHAPRAGRAHIGAEPLISSYPPSRRLRTTMRTSCNPSPYARRYAPSDGRSPRERAWPGRRRIPRWVRVRHWTAPAHWRR